MTEVEQDLERANSINKFLLTKWIPFEISV